MPDTEPRVRARVSTLLAVSPSPRYIGVMVTFCTTMVVAGPSSTIDT